MFVTSFAPMAGLCSFLYFAAIKVFAVLLGYSVFAVFLHVLNTGFVSFCSFHPLLLEVFLKYALILV